MAQFRYLGTAEGYIFVGVPQLTHVEPDGVYEIAEDIQHEAFTDADGVEHPAVTEADCYRCQPELWQEVGSAPAPAPDPVPTEPTEAPA